jgi:hypothetical protein
MQARNQHEDGSKVLSPKLRLTSTGLLVVISQKIELFNQALFITTGSFSIAYRLSLDPIFFD